jgi:DNA-binding NtrC family response regulator
MGANPRLADQALLGVIPPEFAENTASFHGLVGRSPSMRQVIRQMRRMAPNLVMAMLDGEGGTGKTLAARALHAAGPAAHGPFISCLATHFFHPLAADAGLGWSTDLFHKADRGTLFLDRVHQLTPRQQQALDTFLHYWEDRRSMAEPGRLIQIAYRGPAQIVFSSCIELRAATKAPGEGPGSGFRPDLASKLGAVRFRLCPLRERREDIPLLAQLFVQRFTQAYGKPVRGLGPGTIAPLLRHAWPGNVRELEEVIIAASVETESQWIRPIDLSGLAVESRLRTVPPGNNARSQTVGEELNLDHAIRLHVNRVLQRVRGNKLRAAQLLGISRSTLYRILGNAAQGPPAATELPPTKES